MGVGKSPARVGAWGALILGVLNAAVSGYWGLGGTRLLDTVGGALEAQGRARNPVLIAAVWLAVCLKLCAVAIGLVALKPVSHQGWGRMRAVGWAAGGILCVYGGVLTLAGMLIQSGLIATAADANRKALRWHAYLWDPWFLVWGGCVLLAMIASRPRNRVREPREGGKHRCHDDRLHATTATTLPRVSPCLREHRIPEPWSQDSCKKEGKRINTSAPRGDHRCAPAAIFR